MSMTKEDRRWLSDVASLGCVVCRNLGWGESPAQLHHIRDGAGVAQRASHREVLPLCPRHHLASYPSGFHANPREWQEVHGTERELLAQVVKEVDALRGNIIGRPS